MFSIEDIRSPRDRVSEEMLRRLLEDEENSTQCAACGKAEPRREQSCATGGCHYVADGASLAMVYSPCQIWRGIYDLETALRRGTLFKELDKPLEVQPRSGRGGSVKGGCGCGK